MNYLISKNLFKTIFASFAIVVSFCLINFIFVNHASADGKQLRTVEFVLGGGSDNTSRTTNTNVYAGSSWNTVKGTAGTTTVKLQGTGISVKDAYIDLQFVRTTAVDITNVSVTSDVSGGPNPGVDTRIAQELSTITQDTATTTLSGYLRSIHNLTNQFDRQSDTTWNSGVSVVIGTTVTGPVTTLRSAKLVITYESDYVESAHNETKTVKFVLDSNDGTDTGSRTTSCPALSICSFDYLADIPDATSDASIQSVWFELTGEVVSSTASTYQPQINGGSSGPAFNWVETLNDDTWINTYFKPTVGGSNFQRNTAQTLNISTGSVAMQGLGGILCVTYDYSTGASAQTETVQYYMTQQTTAPGTTKTTFNQSVTISNTGLSVKNIWYQIDSPIADAQNLTIYGTVGAASEKSNTYTLSGASVNRSGNSATIFYDMSADKASFSSSTITVAGATQMSSTTGDTPSSVALFVTFTWSGSSGGTQTKTIAYAGASPGVTATASQWYNTPVKLTLPETVTKTYRSAWLETTYSHSEGGALQMGNIQTGTNQNNTTITEYDDTVSNYSTTVRDNIGSTVFSGGSTINWTYKGTEINQTHSAADEVFFTNVIYVTYDAGFAVIPAGVTISGVLRQADETTPFGTATALKLSVGGGTAYSTTTASSTGVFSFSGVSDPSAGQVVTIWLDTNGGNQGSLVVKYGSSCTGDPDCTGLDLVLGQVRLQNFDTGSISVAELSSCDNDSGTGCSDTDIGFTANSGLVTTWSSNTLKVVSGTTFTPGNNTTLQSLDNAGVFNAGSFTHTISGSGSSPFDNSGTFNSNTSTVVFNGDADLVVNAQAVDLYNLSFTPTISANRSYTFGAGVVTVGGALFIESNKAAGPVNTLTINLGHDLSVAGLVTISSTNANSASYLDTTISNYALTANSLTMSTTTERLIANSSVITINTNWTSSGSSNFVKGSSSVYFPSNSGSVLSGSTDFATLIFSGTGSSSAAGIISADNLTVGPSATLGIGSNTLTVNNLMTINGTLSGTGSIYLNSASAQLAGSGAITNTGTFYFNQDNQEIVNGADLSIAGPIIIGADYFVTNNGSLESTHSNGINGLTFDSTFIAGDNSLLKVSGDLLTTEGSLDASGIGNKVVYTGASQTFKVPVNLSYYDLELDNASATLIIPNDYENNLGDLIITNGIFDLQTNSQKFTVGGDLVIASGGTLNAPTNTLTLQGDFTHDGTFYHNSGTVEFLPQTNNKTSVISGETRIDLYNITSVPSQGAILEFEAGNTYQFYGSLTLHGQSGKPVWLRSTIPTMQWDFGGADSYDLSYVNVRDVGCSGFSVGIYNNIFNQGHNGTCWGFISLGNGGSGNGPTGGGGSGGSGGEGGGGETGGTTAKATGVVVGGILINIVVTDGGSGYTSVPIIGVCGLSGAGAGALATAILSGGEVTVINVDSGGTGYTNGVIINIGTPLNPEVPGGCGGESGGGAGGGGSGSP
ncbi:MAG: hypothetical protein R3B41_00715 [Candidatus Doudnabacteria bacterium]